MSLPHPGSEPTAEAFILAGGRSSRMGQDKALVAFNCAPLIQHVVTLLQCAGFQPRIAGARSDLSSVAPVIPDDPAHPGLGPLSGICTGLEVTAAQYAIFLPVDLPLMDPSLIAYLVQHAQLTGSAITLASAAGFLETFPVVIDRAAAPVLRARLVSGDRKCLTAFRAAAANLGKPFSALPVELLLQAGHIGSARSFPPHAWFLSINDSVNLASAEALVKRHLQLS